VASSPADSVSSLLITAGVGVDGDSGWVVKVGKLVTQPNTCIAVYDAPGEAPDPKWLLDYPYFQVMIRGEVDDYAGAYQKAKDVKDVLLGVNAQVVNNDRFDGIIGIGDIAFLKYDEKSRPLFSVNFKAFLEPATSALTNRQPL